MTARGLRNNNPGNIDRNQIKWQGMAENQSSDGRFIVFQTPQYGIRAIAKVLMSYEHKYGINTIRGFINRWAPPVENNTLAYVNEVAKDCGVRPDQIIDVDQMRFIRPLVVAIIEYECEGFRYPDAVVDEALHMAGVSDAPPPLAPVAKPLPPPPLAKQTSFVTKAGALGVTSCAMAAEYAPRVKTWADSLKDYTGSPVIQNVVTTMITVAGMLLLWSMASSVFKHLAAKKAAL